MTSSDIGASQRLDDDQVRGIIRDARDRGEEIGVGSLRRRTGGRGTDRLLRLLHEVRAERSAPSAEGGERINAQTVPTQVQRALADVSASVASVIAEACRAERSAAANVLEATRRESEQQLHERDSALRHAHAELAGLARAYDQAEELLAATSTERNALRDQLLIEQARVVELRAERDALSVALESLRVAYAQSQAEHSTVHTLQSLMDRIHTAMATSSPARRTGKTGGPASAAKSCRRNGENRDAATTMARAATGTEAKALGR